MEHNIKIPATCRKHFVELANLLASELELVCLLNDMHVKIKVGWVPCDGIYEGKFHMCV